MGRRKEKNNFTAAGILVRCVLLGILGYYLFWRIVFTLPYRGSWLEMFLGILLVICEFTGLFRLIMLIFNYINFRESPKMMDIYHSEATIESILSEKGAENVDLPDVDIFVTACREPAEILEKTIHACTRFHYPEKEKVHVYLLDDGDSPELERLAAEYGIEYITREVHNAAKAGNRKVSGHPHGSRVREPGLACPCIRFPSRKEKPCPPCPVIS